MDREQEEMQFIGLFGIYKESYKIIFTWRKIFSQITLALILPLSLIFLAHIGITDYLFSNIMRNESRLHHTPLGSRRHSKLSDLISSEWATYWLFKFVYFTFLLIFSLLSTSAVVYTIASIYTARDVTFMKVMSVVPRVWKKLMVTFLSAFAAIFLYNIVAIIVMVIWAFTVGFTDVGVVVFYVVLLCYVVGFVYISVVWHLASVISVLEESYGFQAMMKSKDLIKGKMIIAIVIFFKLNFTLLLIKLMFEMLVVYPPKSIGVVSRIGYGVICFLLLFKLFLFGLVIQTVIYFVCKSYHHENIDKSMLSDHLEVYMGEYEPLKAKDVQLEQLQV